MTTTIQEKSPATPAYSVSAYLALQEKEVEEYRDYLRQKEGHSVDLDYAANEWVVEGNARTFHERYFEHLDDILRTCRSNCGGFEKCRGVKKCPVEVSLVHSIIYDRRFN
jgi:hypothetical protein